MKNPKISNVSHRSLLEQWSDIPQCHMAADLQGPAPRRGASLNRDDHQNSKPHEIVPENIKILHHSKA